MTFPYVDVLKKRKIVKRKLYPAQEILDKRGRKKKLSSEKLILDQNLLQVSRNKEVLELFFLSLKTAVAKDKNSISLKNL